MYKSLRTNLPREVMSFSDLPFGPEFSELRYPSHTAVQDYLMAYADHHTLRPLLSLGRRFASCSHALSVSPPLTFSQSPSLSSPSLSLPPSLSLCIKTYLSPFSRITFAKASFTAPVLRGTPTSLRKGNGRSARGRWGLEAHALQRRQRRWLHHRDV